MTTRKDTSKRKDKSKQVAVKVPTADAKSTELAENSPYRAHDAKIDDLENNTEDSGGEFLTTNHGVRINDNHNSLKAGDRGPTLLEDFILREKITHFDHERIPERVVHARGSAAHGYFQVYESMAQYTKAGFSPGSIGQDTGVCSFLDGGRFARFNRSRPRRAGLCRQVLYAGRELRSGW